MYSGILNIKILKLEATAAARVDLLLNGLSGYLACKREIVYCGVIAY